MIDKNCTSNIIFQPCNIRPLIKEEDHLSRLNKRVYILWYSSDWKTVISPVGAILFFGQQKSFFN